MIFFFTDWLRKYFQDYRYQSINTDDFLSSFESAFPKVSEHIDWKAWLHGEGYLPEIPELDMSLANEAVELATQWLSLFRDVDDLEYDVAIRKCRDVLGSKVEEFAQWDAKQQHGFVTDLRARIVAGEEPEPIVWNVKCPGYLEDIHGFNEISNSEVRFMWCRLALLGCYEGVLENTRNFVSIQGRMKYVRPLYKDMHEIYPKGDYSVDLFAINKSSYHSITVKMIELDLGLSSERKAKG